MDSRSRRCFRHRPRRRSATQPSSPAAWVGECLEDRTLLTTVDFTKIFDSTVALPGVPDGTNLDAVTLHSFESGIATIYLLPRSPTLHEGIYTYNAVTNDFSVAVDSDSEHPDFPDVKRKLLDISTTSISQQNGQVLFGAEFGNGGGPMGLYLADPGSGAITPLVEDTQEDRNRLPDCEDASNVIHAGNLGSMNGGSIAFLACGGIYARVGDQFSRVTQFPTTFSNGPETVTSLANLAIVDDEVYFTGFHGSDPFNINREFFMAAGGEVTRLFEDGDPIPGGGTIQSFEPAVVGIEGPDVFIGGTVPWLKWDGEELSAIPQAPSGGQVPGQPAGTQFRTLGPVDISNGRLLYIGTFTNPFVQQYGLYTGEPGGPLTRIVDTTQTLDGRSFFPRDRILTAKLEGDYVVFHANFEDQDDPSVRDPMMFLATFQEELPPAPVMTSPAGDVSSLRPTFEWTSVDVAESYDLWVTSTADPFNPVIRQAGITGTSVVSPVALPAGTYSAQVATINAGGQASEWSDPVSFSTHDLECTAPAASSAAAPAQKQDSTPSSPPIPVLSGPSGVVNTSVPLTFTWPHTCAESDTYEFMVATPTVQNAQYYTPVHTKTGRFGQTDDPTRSYTIPSNVTEKGGQHEVRVRVIIPGRTPQESDWSNPVTINISDSTIEPLTFTSPNGIVGQSPTFDWETPVDLFFQGDSFGVELFVAYLGDDGVRDPETEPAELFSCRGCTDYTHELSGGTPAKLQPGLWAVTGRYVVYASDTSPAILDEGPFGDVHIFAVRADSERDTHDAPAPEEAAVVDIFIDNLTTGEQGVHEDSVSTTGTQNNAPSVPGFVIADSGRTATFTLPPELPAAVYSVRTRWRDAAGRPSPWSVPELLTLDGPGHTPGKPTLTGLAPDSDLTADTTPVLTWDDLIGATRFELKIDDETNGVPNIVNLSSVDSEFHELANAIVPGEYSYQLRGFNESGEAGPWSDPRLFSIIAETLDIDGNGRVDLFTDGILIARHMAGFTGSALVDGATGSGATRTSAGDIASYLSRLAAALDVDDDGTRNLFTDGILAVRYFAGFTGTALTDGALGSAATRTAPGVVAFYLDQFQPVAVPVQSSTRSAAESAGPTMPEIEFASHSAEVQEAPVGGHESTSGRAGPVAARPFSRISRSALAIGPDDSRLDLELIDLVLSELSRSSEQAV